MGNLPDLFNPSKNNDMYLELIADCFDEWVRACNKDIEWQDSDEYIKDAIEANEYDYLKDGTQY